MSEDSKSCEKEQQCDHKSKTVPMLETSNVSSASAKAIYYISISMQKNKIIII